MTSLADIRGFVVAGAGAGAYTVAPDGQSGTKNAYVVYEAPGTSEKIYYAFTLEALQVIANAESVLPSSNTNIHLYTDVESPQSPQIVDYFSKQQQPGVLQHEAILTTGGVTGEIPEYLSFNVPPKDFLFIDPNTTYQIKYYTNPNNLSEVATYSKFIPNEQIYENLGNGIFVVYNEVDFLRAAIGTKLDASGDSIAIVAAEGIIKYVKADDSIEYYQKAASGVAGTSGSAYFKQVNVNEAFSPIVISDYEGNIIWREYGTEDAINIETFATNSYFAVNQTLYSGGKINSDDVWVTGMSGETVRKFVKEFDGSLKEEVAADTTYHFVYDSLAFKNAVIDLSGSIIGHSIVDLRADLANSNEISLGGVSVGSAARKRPSRSYAEKFEVHKSMVLKREVASKMVYFNYFKNQVTDVSDNLSEYFFSTEAVYSDASSGDHLYQMASYDASTNADLSVVSAAFSKEAHGLLRERKTSSTLGEALTTYRAYNQNGLKSAANKLADGDKVIEKTESDVSANMVADREWIKYDEADTLQDASENNFITFYQAASLDGATAFPLSRKDFAEGNSKYLVGDTLIQRIVTSDLAKTDIESTKLGANAVNKVDDASNSYAYLDTGLATAARSADSKATVKLVTAADYHQDSTGVVDYTREKQYLLKLSSTYLDYSDLSGALGLDIKTFANGTTYTVNDTLSHRNTSTGAEIDYYIKRFAGLVEDVSGVANGQEDSSSFADNGKAGSIFYSYVDISGIMNADFNTDMPADMVVIQTAQNNEPSATEMSNSSYYKRIVGLAQYTGGTNAGNCFAWNHLALKEAANIMTTGKTVTEKGDTLTDGTVWTKDATANTLNNAKTDASGIFLTFYQADDLSGALAFPLTREAFATGSYVLGATIIQRLVLSATSVSEVTSKKLGSSAVYMTAVTGAKWIYDASNSYVYGDEGMATAATAALARNVKLVTANDYHQDSGSETIYTRQKQYLLKLNTTYLDYSDLSGALGLDIRTFATNTTYLVGDILEHRNTSTGALIDRYTKYFADLAGDSTTTESGTEANSANDENVTLPPTIPGTVYYAYADISGIINAPDASVANGIIIVETTGNNEPSKTDLISKSYYKTAVGLAQKTSSTTTYHAYSQIGMYSFAILTDKSGATVTEGTTGFGSKSYTTIWTWLNQNELRSGSSPYTYLSYPQGTSSLTEQMFATSTTYSIDGTGAVLKLRTLSAVAVDDSATTASDEVITKVSHDLTKSDQHANEFHAYSAIGRLNAAIDSGDLAANYVVLDRSVSPAVSYTYVEQYVLQKTGENKYYEYSGLIGDVSANSVTTASTLSALTLREVATGSVITYPNDTQVIQMRQSGGIHETFEKKYAPSAALMLATTGVYYAFNAAGLEVIAKDEDRPVGTVTPTGSFTQVWEMTSDSLPDEDDTLWKKIEQYVLRAAIDETNNKYRDYIANGVGGIPLNEFACKDVSANDVREFKNGDQLIDMVNSVTYTRVLQSVLDKSGDSSNIFYVYSYGTVIPAHLTLKAAAIASEDIIPIDSTLITEDSGSWTKEAVNLVSQAVAGDTNYRTFEDVTGDAEEGIVGARAFAISTEFTTGSALRTIKDASDLSGSRYLKVLPAVLYHFETDLYDVYYGEDATAINGLRNIAQAVDLSENRTPTYILRPQVNEIEVGAFILDVSNSAYYQKTERYVLLAVDPSGETDFTSSNPAHYYDYTAGGNFGTFTLSELAAGSTYAVGTLLTDAIVTANGTFEKVNEDALLREGSGAGGNDEYYVYSDISGTEWVAKNRSIGSFVIEKTFASLKYQIVDQNVLADASGAVYDASSNLSIPAPTTFYAYNVTSDTSGILIVSFAAKINSPIDRAFMDGDKLIDRTSSRTGQSYEITTDDLLKLSATVYNAYSQEGLKSFAALDLSEAEGEVEVTEQAGVDADAWGDASGDVIQDLTYTWVSLNVIKVGTATDYYVYNLSSDASGLTLNTFATSASYPKTDRLFNRDTSTKVDSTTVVEGNLYDGPVYTKVLLQGVLSRKADQYAAADAELRTYDASGVVLGLRAAALAEVSDISDGTVLIPQNDDPANNHLNKGLETTYARRLRCSKGLLRVANSHDATTTYEANFMAFQDVSGSGGEDMPYKALKQAAKNIDAAGSAVPAGDRQVAAESKIYVTAHGELTTYNTDPSTISYTKDDSNYPDTLRVGNFGPLVAADKITFADYPTDLRKVMVNFCESDADGNNATDSKAGLYAGKTMTVYTVDEASTLPEDVYTVVRRGLMSKGTVNVDLEYYTFSDNGLVAAAVAAEKNQDGKFSYLKADGTVEEFRRVAKGLLVSNKRLNGTNGTTFLAPESTQPTAAIMYFADYDSTKDDDKANMYFYLYSLAVNRGIGIDLSGSSTTADSKTYTRDANGVLQAPTDVSDGIIDSVSLGSITTLYSIVSTIGTTGGTYAAEKYELIADVSNSIMVTPITSGGGLASEDVLTGTDPSGTSFYVAYSVDGMERTTAAAGDALNGLSNAPREVVPRNAYIYLGDKYTIDTGARYIKYDVGSLTDPDGNTLTTSLQGLRAFAHKYSSRTADRSRTLTVGVSGEATDASGVYTQYQDYVYYWFEKGVVLAYKLSSGSALATSEFSYRPSGLSTTGTAQRFDIFYLDNNGDDEPDVHDFIKRAALADISGGANYNADAYADFQAGAFQAGAKFVIHNSNDTEAFPEDMQLFKITSGLMAKAIDTDNTNAANYEYYAFNDYALAFGANDQTVVKSELIRRMESTSADIAAPVTNNWQWETTGLVQDVSGAESGEVWRLYTNDDRAHGRGHFALNSDLDDEMSYYTYAYPDTTTLVYTYKNVLSSGTGYYNDISNNTQGVVLLSGMNGPNSNRDPAASTQGYMTYGNAGLALIANSSLAGTTDKTTEFAVLSITEDLSGIKIQVDSTNGTYKKLQQGAMYSGDALVLYDEARFQEIMDRDDIVEFASMDANNLWATVISRSVLSLTPLERIFVPDASGNNQGSAKIFTHANLNLSGTLYKVEKVLERDVLSSSNNPSSYTWSLDMIDVDGREAVTSKVMTVTNKNASTITFKNRTWLRPIELVD